MRFAAVSIVAVLLLAELYLLLSGARILISQRRVNPGEHYVVPEYGDLGSAKQAQLVCRYFTGRSVLTKVLWYSSDGVMGSDECSFLDRPSHQG